VKQQAGGIQILDSEATAILTDSSTATLRVSNAITTEGDLAVFRLTLSRA
jgi:hypothetical protein